MEAGNMRFGSVGSVIFFWAVVGLALFFIWAFKRRAKLTEAFAQKKLQPRIAENFSIKRAYFKAVLLVVVSALIVFALMRPQWGFHWQQVKRTGIDIIIAIDTSRSMLAEDVKPNRLERCKLAIIDMLRKLQGDRVGLVAFSGTAFTQCPLTSDYNGFVLALNDIDTSTIPRGGTAISQAIKEAIGGFEAGSKKYRALVIITDGEDHEGDALKQAEDASREGIKIFCVGIGTSAGELIPITDESGNKSFLKDKSGNMVKSSLNENLLQKIALATGGAYVHAASSGFGLDELYDKRISKMEERQIESKAKKRFEERFQIPLMLALLLLILEPFISERKR